MFFNVIFSFDHRNVVLEALCIVLLKKNWLTLTFALIGGIMLAIITFLC
jgi:hypothetical protein